MCNRCGNIGQKFKDYLDHTWGAFGNEAALFEPPLWAHHYRPERFRRLFRTSNYLERFNRQFKENLKKKCGLMRTAGFLNDQVKLSEHKLEEEKQRVKTGMII